MADEQKNVVMMVRVHLTLTTLVSPCTSRYAGGDGER